MKLLSDWMLIILLLVLIIYVILGAFAIFTGTFELKFVLGVSGLIMGLAALFIALHSSGIADLSDDKMQDIAEYLFFEKLAVLNDIAMKISMYKHEEYTDRVINDLSAVERMIPWILNEEKINDFLNVIDKIVSGAEATRKSEQNEDAKEKIGHFLMKINEYKKIIQEIKK